MTGDREHWHPTTELEDLEEYSDEELVEILEGDTQVGVEEKA